MFAHQYVFWGFDPVRTLKDASVKLLVSPPPDEGTGAGNPQPQLQTPQTQHHCERTVSCILVAYHPPVQARSPSLF